MPVTTVITHLSNNSGWVPPVPPEPPVPPTPVLDDYTYFDNNTFNEDLVPAGFDFENNVVITDDSELQSLLYEGAYKEYADNGTIVKAKMYDSSCPDTWTLTENGIEYHHFYNSEGSSYGGEALVMPIVGWSNSSCKYINLQVNFTSSNIGDASSLPILMIGSYNESTPEYNIGYYETGDGIDSIIYSIPLSSIQFGTTPEEFSIDLLMLYGVNEEVDREYTFTITKIWCTEAYPAQTFWINGPGINPVQPINNQYPYLTIDSTQEHAYNIVGDFQGIVGSNNVGITAIRTENYSSRTQNAFRMSLLDENGDESNYYLYYLWSVYRSTINGAFMLIQKSSYTPLLYSMWEIDYSGNNKGIYIYAGADTFPLAVGTQSPVVYGGMAYIDDNNIIHHKGFGIDLDYLEQTYGVHLPDDLLTPAN